MPRSKSSLALAHYTLLGFLQLEPSHGYDLLRRLRLETGAGRIIPLKAATLYSVLHDLEKRGLIVGEALPESYPPRTRFHLTEGGRAAFAAWLAEPVRHIREVRSDFLLKVYFSGLLGGDGGLALLERQIAIISGYREKLGEELLAYPPDSFDHLVVESKLSGAECTLAWLKRQRARLARAGRR